MKECQLVCKCEEPKVGSYFLCNYGDCEGRKCNICGDWIAEQEAHCCNPYNKGECPECQNQYCIQVFFPGKTEPGIHSHYPATDEGLEKVTDLERQYTGQDVVFVDAYHCQERKEQNNA